MQQLKCPQCGHSDARVKAVFCPNCGYKFSGLIGDAGMYMESNEEKLPQPKNPPAFSNGLSDEEKLPQPENSPAFLNSQKSLPYMGTIQIPSDPPPSKRSRRRASPVIPGFSPGFDIFSFLRPRPQKTGKIANATSSLTAAPSSLIGALGYIVAAAILVVVAPLALLLPQWLSSPSGSAHLTPSSSLVVPGGSIKIHGSNFPPNSTVAILVDGTPTASINHSLQAAQVSLSIWSIALQERLRHTPANTVKVGSDGTFDTTITAPTNWTPGSHHTIWAQAQGAPTTVEASVNVTVGPHGPAPKQTPGPTPKPTPSPTPGPPPGGPTPGPTPDPTPPSGPTVTGISPASGPESGGTTVTITGSGFTGVTSVLFGNTPAHIISKNDKQITVTSPSGTGMVEAQVITPSGSSDDYELDDYDDFTYSTQAPTPPPTPTPSPTPTPGPVVTGISPTSGPESGGANVIITGSGFTGATGVSVSFGGTAASHFNVDSDTQITATSPAGTGTVDVTVTVGSVTSATSSADQFAYLLAPDIANVSPTSGPESGGTTVTINGDYFIPGATSVLFGNTPASNITVSSDRTQITATSPAGTGTVPITVTTAGGSAHDQFTYIPPPTVTGISPSNGSSAGGTTVIITGTGFTGATGVSFGGTAASSFTVDSDTQITAVSPAGTGTGDITVTTAAGTSTTNSNDQFTYLKSS